MNNELVSVIIPIYKVEPYLRKCVESVTAQTYKNLEIILVDDGSPDNCGKICDEYALKESRIIVIHKKNGGISDARNAGLERATGKYITFVDGDDWVEPGYCGVLYENMMKYDADVSCCGHFMDVGIVKKREMPARDNILTNLESIEKLPASSWAKMYRKELFEKLWFPYGRCHEDMFTTYKVLYRAGRVVNTTVMLYNYFRRSDSTMGTKVEVRHLLVLEAIKERVDFFKARGHNDMAVKTQKNLVARIAEFKVCFQRDRKKYGKEVLEYIGGEMKSAVVAYRENKNQPLMHVMEVFLYEKFPRLAVSLALIKKRAVR